jgi:hypothetical protein
LNLAYTISKLLNEFFNNASLNVIAPLSPLLTLLATVTVIVNSSPYSAAFLPSVVVLVPVTSVVIERLLGFLTHIAL